MRTSTAIALLFVLAGCATTRTYQVSVKNQTGDAITIGLVKEGEPTERAWVSPEDAAIHGVTPSPEMWAAIPPEKTADAGPVKGRFKAHAIAVLRVYDGKLSLSDILAISRGQRNRIDIPLHSGLNRVIVTDADGRFSAIRDDGVTLVGGQQ